MIELDVRRTGDGIYIVYHDPMLNGEMISQSSYAEIQKSSIEKGFRIPELHEVLELGNQELFLDIELKETGYETDVVEFILEYLKPQRFMISSFNDESIVKIKNNFPDVTTGLILGMDKPEKLIRIRLSEVFFHRRYRRTGADVLIPHYRLFNIWNFLFYFSLKNPVFIWTVNDVKRLMKYSKKKNITGIITNYPDLLADILRRNE